MSIPLPSQPALPSIPAAQPASAPAQFQPVSNPQSEPVPAPQSAPGQLEAVQPHGMVVVPSFEPDPDVVKYTMTPKKIIELGDKLPILVKQPVQKEGGGQKYYESDIFLRLDKDVAFTIDLGKLPVKLYYNDGTRAIKKQPAQGAGAGAKDEESSFKKGYSVMVDFDFSNPDHVDICKALNIIYFTGLVQRLKDRDYENLFARGFSAEVPWMTLAQFPKYRVENGRPNMSAPDTWKLKLPHWNQDARKRRAMVYGLDAKVMNKWDALSGHNFDAAITVKLSHLYASNGMAYPQIFITELIILSTPIKVELRPSNPTYFRNVKQEDVAEYSNKIAELRQKSEERRKKQEELRKAEAAKHGAEAPAGHGQLQPYTGQAQPQYGAPPQFPGAPQGQQAQFPGHGQAPPQFPGQGQPQFPGAPQGPQFPGHGQAPPQFPGQGQAPQFPGQPQGQQPQFPGQAPPQFPGAPQGQQPQFPGQPQPQAPSGYSYAPGVHGFGLPH